MSGAGWEGVRLGWWAVPSVRVGCGDGLQGWGQQAGEGWGYGG